MARIQFSRSRLVRGTGITVTLLLVIICGLVWSTHIWPMISCAWIWLNSGSMEPETNGAVLRNLALVAAAGLGLILATWRSYTASRQAGATQDSAATAERGHQNERYQTGANMLGDETLATKLGGIYALARLAQEHSEEYHFQIMMLLNTFVKDYEDHENTQGTTQCPPDIKAAVQALGQRNANQLNVESKRQELKIDLSGINLTNVDLTKANLSNANLTNANLTNAVLTDAVLKNAILKTAELKDCKLMNASLESANLESTNLELADLSRANLKEANLDSANITGANLSGARLDKAVLQGAVLTHACLEGAVLMEANVMDANLAETDLTSAILTHADLTNVNFTNADISGAILSESKGLTQEAVDQAQAADWRPPILKNVHCSKTGEKITPPSRSTT